MRLTDQGEIPDDNPFIKESGARAEIWSYGIRNPQGMAMNPWSNALWLNEHGPRGGDEINIPQKGKNYGWPLATWGMDSSALSTGSERGDRRRDRATCFLLERYARCERHGLL